MALKKSHLKFLPPLVLILVVVCQVFWVHTAHLTSWRGGGFGMFSTVDGHAGRRVRILGKTEDGTTYRLIVPSKFFRTQKKVHVNDFLWSALMPREKSLKTLGEKLIDLDFKRSGRKQTAILKESLGGNLEHIFFENPEEEPKRFASPIVKGDIVSPEHKVRFKSLELSAWSMTSDSKNFRFSWKSLGDRVEVKKT